MLWKLSIISALTIWNISRKLVNFSKAQALAIPSFKLKSHVTSVEKCLEIVKTLREKFVPFATEVLARNVTVKAPNNSYGSSEPCKGGDVNLDGKMSVLEFFLSFPDLECLLEEDL